MPSANPLPQDVPTLTVYRSSLVNLNGEATRLLPKGTESGLLLPPIPARPRWALLTGQSGFAGDFRLYGRADRVGTLRFRAPSLALALFAALPPDQPTLRLRLVPDSTYGGLFYLAP
jgi:hypothetical protein